jgi:hypothetical protein
VVSVNRRFVPCWRVLVVVLRSVFIHSIAEKVCSRKLTPIRERKRSLENTSRSAYGTNFDYVPSYWSTSIGLLDRVRERRRFHGIVGNYKEQELVFS